MLAAKTDLCKGEDSVLSGKESMATFDPVKKLFSLLNGKIPSELNQPEPGWEPVAGIAELAHRSPKFVSADQEKDRILIRFFRVKMDGSLRGKVCFGPLCEGPPGAAHGGSVAAVLDEAMGQSSWIAGYPVVAAKIEVNFRKPVPLQTLLWLEASVSKVEGRKVFITGRLLTPDGEILADSNGIFVILKQEDQLKIIKSLQRPMT